MISNQWSMFQALQKFFWWLRRQSCWHSASPFQAIHSKPPEWLTFPPFPPPTHGHCTASSHLTGRGNIASDDFPNLKAWGLFLAWKRFSPRNIHASIRSKVNLLLHLYHSWIYPFDLTGKEVAGWTPQCQETVSGSFLLGKCSEHLHKDRLVFHTLTEHM